MSVPNQSGVSRATFGRQSGVVETPLPTRRPKRRFDLLPHLMTLPGFVIMLLILGIPVGYNIYIGFTNASAFTGLQNPRWVGLGAYRWVFSDPNFWEAFRRTLIWTFSSLALQVALGMLLALVLHELPMRWSKILQPLWLIPWVLPAVSVFYVWRLYFNPQIGPIQRFFERVGLVDSPMLTDPRLALWAVILAGLWKGFPFYMIVFFSALQSVPQDLYDAARVDGANRARIFWSVERPEIQSVAIPACVLGFIWIFNWFTPIFAMTEGGPGNATRIVGIYVYDEALRGFRYNTAAAASTSLIGLVAIFFLTYLLINWQVVRSGKAAG